MKRVVAIVLLLCVAICGFAQDWTKTTVPVSKELKVGDKIPFTEFQNVLNYPKRSLKFSDRKPKLTILDFWSTTCGPCVMAWPKMLELQKEFGKDIQIILVDKYERQDKVKDFVTRRKRSTGVDMNLPISCRDTTIWDYFPQNIIPRYVWIGSDGVVGSITLGKEVTRENIRKWITSGPLAMNQIVEKKWYGVKRNMPIFVNGNGGERSSDVFIWSSSLTKGQDDLGGDARITYDSIDGYEIILTGASILSLYGNAYNNRLREWDYFDYLPYGRMELIVKDTARYYWPALAGSMGTTGGAMYNYQLIPGTPRSRDELLTMMQEDLKRYFGLEVKWEKRKKKSLVFTMFDSTLVKGKSTGTEIGIHDFETVLDSVTVKDVITCMEMASRYRYKWYPIVDETGYKGVLTGIRTDENALDPVIFDKVLSKHGMHLKFEMREVDVLVLREPVVPMNQGKYLDGKP